ncbi:MAG: hypothetical protein JWN79_430 [Gemmatimonadetes bacterium]|jgi:uncharacterized membrane protein|nr:hypothetical protein [Gemmatimonadota bacterium]
MLAALISLAGVFVALYLALYKLGYIGTLVCAVGSCEVVQTSRWATLLGVPVAIWGVVYYAGVLAAALVGLSGALVDSRPFARALVAVTAVGVLFSLWLTWLELFVIHAICMWCVVSALLATALFIAWWLDLRELDVLARDDLAAQAAAELRGPGFGRGIRNTEEVSIRAIRTED